MVLLSIIIMYVRQVHLKLSQFGPSKSNAADKTWKDSIFYILGHLERMSKLDFGSFDTAGLTIS